MMLILQHSFCLLLGTNDVDTTTPGAIVFFVTKLLVAQCTATTTQTKKTSGDVPLRNVPLRNVALNLVCAFRKLIGVWPLFWNLDYSIHQKIIKICWYLMSVHFNCYTVYSWRISRLSYRLSRNWFWYLCLLRFLPQIKIYFISYIRLKLLLMTFER